jgi:hypothetical protein
VSTSSFVNKITDAHNVMLSLDARNKYLELVLTGLSQLEVITNPFLSGIYPISFSCGIFPFQILSGFSLQP